MRSLICTVCLIGQCIEDMVDLGSFSGRSFKLNKTCQSDVQTKNILLFDTNFGHVAMLVTEISSQDQIFRIIPRETGLRPFQGGTYFVDHLCFLCLVFLMLSRLFIAALWSPAGKGLAFWLFLVMFNAFVTFPCGIQFLDKVWYLIVSFSDLCHLSYFANI